jgi:hypothetical protein
MRKKRKIWLLILSFLSLAGIAYLVFFTAPNQQVLILDFQFSNLIPLCILIFSFFFFLFSCIFRKARHGIFAGLLAMSLLLLLLYKLANAFFILLLLALFVLLEFLFK